MSEVSFQKVLWESKTGDAASAMESCYKLYTWINHTVLMLLFQIFWKVSQISDYLTGKTSDASPEMLFTFSPLTRESKLRRHIRSMSDVQSSTPYRIAFRSRIGSNHTLMYDSDTHTRVRRIRPHHRYQEPDSSDSSDYYESSKKVRSLGRNIMKHTDSMRIL